MGKRNHKNKDLDDLVFRAFEEAGKSGSKPSVIRYAIDLARRIDNTTRSLKNDGTAIECTDYILKAAQRLNKKCRFIKNLAEGGSLKGMQAQLRTFFREEAENYKPAFQIRSRRHSTPSSRRGRFHRPAAGQVLPSPQRRVAGHPLRRRALRERRDNQTRAPQ